jgi:hypothetical protein
VVALSNGVVNEPNTFLSDQLADEHDVLLVDVQLMVELDPCMTDAGWATIVTTGGESETTGEVPPPPPHATNTRDELKATISILKNGIDWAGSTG